MINMSTGDNQPGLLEALASVRSSIQVSTEVENAPAACSITKKGQTFQVRPALAYSLSPGMYTFRVNFTDPTCGRSDSLVLHHEIKDGLSGVRIRGNGPWADLAPKAQSKCVLGSKLH